LIEKDLDLEIKKLKKIYTDFKTYNPDKKIQIIKNMFEFMDSIAKTEEELYYWLKEH
jgi:hypothetical protein